MKKMINLFSPYYQCGEPERQKELDFVRDKNEANPLLKVYYFEGRPCYNDFFAATKSYPNDINVLANADIYFDESVELMNDIALRECYALTRCELVEGEVVTFEERAKYNRFAPPKWSQDVWAFRGAVEIHGPWFLGTPGCDNRIAYEIRRAGYTLLNRCYDINCIHVHKDEFRNYTIQESVPRPYLPVQPIVKPLRQKI